MRRVRGLIKLRLAKNMLTKQPALHPHMGPVEKTEVKGNLPKKSKISWEPLPSTSQDYSSSWDLEHFEEDEAFSKT